MWFDVVRCGPMWSDAVISHTRHIAASLAFLLINLEINVYATIKLLFTRLRLLDSTVDGSDVSTSALQPTANEIRRFNSLLLW